MGISMERFVRAAAVLLVAGLMVAGCSESGGEGGDYGDGGEAGVDSSVLRLSQAPVLTDVPYSIGLKPLTQQPMEGLHSFAYGVHDGNWLIIGGRKDGFHRTSALGGNFNSQFANNEIIVLDQSNWKVSTMPLPSELRPFLQSSNTEFCVDGDVLYIIGGYGSGCEENKPECYGTYPNVTAVMMPELIHGVKAGTMSIGHHFVSVTDERMRVTGGGLEKIGDDFYLVFGQNYDQEYEPGVTGRYTEQISRFRLDPDFKKKTLKITNYETFGDPTGVKGPASLYHRRDLNVVQAINPDGTNGIGIYGGVFDSTGGGWVNPMYVNATDGTPQVVADMNTIQKTNQYECAHILMYDPASKTMFTTFLGGISGYAYADGTLRPDPLLPWVNIISTMMVRSDGTVKEAVQPQGQGMPKLMGANGMFAPAKGLMMCDGTENVLDFGKLPPGDSILIGYFYGGILASAPQSDEARPTQANSTIYEVWMTRKG